MLVWVLFCLESHCEMYNTLGFLVTFMGFCRRDAVPNMLRGNSLALVVYICICVLGLGQGDCFFWLMEGFQAESGLLLSISSHEYFGSLLLVI